MLRARDVLMCVLAALVVLTCAGLFLAAALVPAPPAVLPFVVVVSIAGPMIAAWELRGALGTVRRRSRVRGSGSAAPDGSAPLDTRAVAALRAHLKQLPETQHPLGF
jgi:hypothetical protein